MTGPVLFDGSAPDREWVLDHGFEINLQYFKAKLPNERLWPGELDESPIQGRYPFVDRRRVFSVAHRAATSDDPYAAAQLMTAAFVWGTVKTGNGPYRRYRAFADPESLVKLTKALHLVREEGALSAYRAMWGRGSLKIAFLDSAFFTKFLYFGGYGAKRYLQQPLILDRHVARALSHFTALDWSGVSWTRDQYSTYLDLVRDWATEYDTDEDVVERRLFQEGKRLEKGL